MTHPNAPLRITTRRDGTTAVLQVAGELDLATHQQLRDHVHDALTTHPTAHLLLLDLGRLTFTDCAGLAALGWARNHTHTCGAAFRIHDPNPHIARVLRLANLNTGHPAGHHADPHPHSRHGSRQGNSRARHRPPANLDGAA